MEISKKIDKVIWHGCPKEGINMSEDNNTVVNNNQGLDKLLGELSVYKGFIIKFTALIFHDDIISDNGQNGATVHIIEHFVFWVLAALLPFSVVKVFIKSCNDVSILLEKCKRLRFYEALGVCTIIAVALFFAIKKFIPYP